MFEQNLMVPLTFSLMISSYHNSFAFDPVTLMAASGSASSMVKGFEKPEEAADLGFAMSDLLNDLGLDYEYAKDIDQAVTKLNAFRSRVDELKWAQQDLRNSLEVDLQRGKNLTAKIKALRNALQASRRIATVMGLRPRAADKAVKIQGIRINTMILEELQHIRQAQYLGYLENKEAKVRREIYLQEILETKSGPNRGGKRL